MLPEDRLEEGRVLPGARVRLGTYCEIIIVDSRKNSTGKNPKRFYSAFYTFVTFFGIITRQHPQLDGITRVVLVPRSSWTNFLDIA
jgi:hypothetical protein